MSVPEQMSGAQLRAHRDRLGMTQEAFGRMLGDALGRRYGADNVGKWERGTIKVPRPVATLLEYGADDTIAATAADAKAGRGQQPTFTIEDSAPAADGPEIAAGNGPTLFGGAQYAKICEQFFELIATGVGMVGAGIGNETIKRDGEIILANKQQMGAAYGKLAETNEVFRNLLLSSDRQGAYLAVALATGTTAGEIWRNHSLAAAGRQRQARADEVLAADLAAQAETPEWASAG